MQFDIKRIAEHLVVHSQLRCLDAKPTATMEKPACRSRLNLIRRKRGQTLVVHRTTHGEVIQALPGVILQSEQCMHFIIEKTANPRGAYSGGFGFKIERLAENAALPEEVTITPWLF